jgi:hypothetical protein
LSENVANMKDQLDMTIASRTQARVDMTRRISALLGAMMYISALGVGWRAFLTDMGRLDDREEEEELASYLARKMGVEIGNSFAGMFPFVRDIYGFVAQGYSFDSIDEVRALQTTIDVFMKLFEDIVSGEQINPYKTARNIATFGTRTFGIPAANIEKIDREAIYSQGHQLEQKIRGNLEYLKKNILIHAYLKLKHKEF